MDRDETFDRRIQSDIEAHVLSGDWPPGHRIPFEVDLAERYGCSRMTVNKVLTRLAAAGLLERRRKSGTFVAMPNVQSAVLEIHDIAAEVAALGLAYRFERLRQQRRKLRAGETFRLDLPAGASVLEIVSVHHAGGRPFCHEERIVNLAAVPEAAQMDFSQTPPGPWLVREVPWSIAEHLIRAVPARGEHAAALCLPEGTACLSVERRTRNDAGIVTHVVLTYPGDKHALTAQFTPPGVAR